MKHIIRVEDFYGYENTHEVAAEFGNGIHKTLLIKWSIDHEGAACFNWVVTDHSKVIIETVFFDVAVDAYNIV